MKTNNKYLLLLKNFSLSPGIFNNYSTFFYSTAISGYRSLPRPHFLSPFSFSFISKFDFFHTYRVLNEEFKDSPQTSDNKLSEDDYIPPYIVFNEKQRIIKLPANSFFAVFSPVYIDKMSNFRYSEIKSVFFDQRLHIDKNLLFNFLTEKNIPLNITIVYSPVDSVEYLYNVKNPTRFVDNLNYDFKKEYWDVLISSQKYLMKQPMKWLGESFHLFIFINFTSYFYFLFSMFFYHNLIITGGDQKRRHLIGLPSFRLFHYLEIFFRESLPNIYQKGVCYDLPKNKFNPIINIRQEMKNEISQDRFKLSNNFVESLTTFFPDLKNIKSSTIFYNKNKGFECNPISYLSYTKLEVLHKRSIENREINKILSSTNNPFKSEKYKNRTNWSNTAFYHTKRNFDEKMSFYSDIKQFLSSNPINKQTQIEIENFLRKKGIYDFMENINKSKTLSPRVFSKSNIDFLFLVSPEIKIIINRFLNLGGSYISLGVENPTYLLKEVILKIGLEIIIEIILGCYINIISFKNSTLNKEKNYLHNIIEELSSITINEYFRLLYFEKRKELYNEKLNKNYTFSDWKKENYHICELLTRGEVKIFFGANILQWMIDSGLVKSSNRKEGYKKYKCIISTEEAYEKWEKVINSELSIVDKTPLIKENDLKFLNIPNKLPLIVEPKKYFFKDNGEIALGGYLTNDIEFTEEIIISKISQRVKTEIKQENKILSCINNMNSIPFKINEELLFFIQTKKEIFGKSLIDEKILHTLYNKKKLTKKEKNELKSYESKLELQYHILKIADLYSVIPEFYFINKIDYRGRIYCNTDYLNFQSVELAKALLLFSRPSFVSRNDEKAEKYLKIYGANCFGNKLDKLSFEKRIEWIDSNMNNVLNYENGILISKAENQFLFTAFCIEFKKWFEFCTDSNEFQFETYLPIQLDAGCNGFQHLVLLSRETDLLSKLNLTQKQFKDEPDDFYSFVIFRFNERIKNKLEDSKLELRKRKIYEKLFKLGISRKLIKIIVMIDPYNAGNDKMINELKELMIEGEETIKNGEKEKYWYLKDKPEIKLYNIDLFYFVITFRIILNEIAPKVRKLRIYLSKIAKCCSELNLHIPWHLPSGLQVNQSYLDEEDFRVKLFSYSDSRTSFKRFTTSLNINKQKTSFMPNLIHSLDATALALLSFEYFSSPVLKTKNFFSVHDCFASTMDHVFYIVNYLKSVYNQIYFDNSFLKQLNDDILNHIGKNYDGFIYDEKKEKLIVKVNNERRVFPFPNIKVVLGEELKTFELKDGLNYIID